MPDRDFVVAVQWHPEETLQDLRLFSGIVTAAQTPRDPQPAGSEGEAMTTTDVINPATEQVLRTVELLDTVAVDEAIAGPRAPRRLGRQDHRRIVRPRCARSPPSSTPTSRNWRHWRWPIPVTRSARRSGRPDMCAMCSSTTRRARNG